MTWLRNITIVVAMVTGDDVDTEWRVDADGRTCLSELPGRRGATEEGTRAVPGRYRGRSNPPIHATHTFSLPRNMSSSRSWRVPSTLLSSVYT